MSSYLIPAGCTVTTHVMKLSRELERFIAHVRHSNYGTRFSLLAAELVL